MLVVKLNFMIMENLYYNLEMMLVPGMAKGVVKYVKDGVRVRINDCVG